MHRLQRTEGGSNLKQVLSGYPEWRRLLTSSERQLLLENAERLRHARLGTAVITGSPSFVQDPIWEHLEAVVQKRTPQGHPAAFYVYSDGDLFVLALGNKFHDPMPPPVFDKEQTVFIRGIGHNDYFLDTPMGLGLVADLLRDQRLSEDTSQALAEHNGDWFTVRPSGSDRAVLVRRLQPSLWVSTLSFPLPVEDPEHTVEDALQRVRSIRKTPHRPPRILLYGERGFLLDALTEHFRARKAEVICRYGPVDRDAPEVATRLALSLGADVALIVPSAASSPSEIKGASSSCSPFSLSSSSSVPGPGDPGRFDENHSLYTLEEAIARGWVTCSGAATVQSDGFRGILRLRQENKEPFWVLIPAGLILKSHDALTQDLILW